MHTSRMLVFHFHILQFKYKNLAVLWQQIQKYFIKMRPTKIKILINHFLPYYVKYFSTFTHIQNVSHSKLLKHMRAHFINIT